jgi:hypothetical protein
MPSLAWSFDSIIEYKYDQSSYDTSKPYDDSNYKEILTYGEGRKDFLDTRGYENLPTIQEIGNANEDSGTRLDEYSYYNVIRERSVNHPM